MSLKKFNHTPQAALVDVLRDGMTIMSGGFGLCGIPAVLIDTVVESGVRELTIISNNPGTDGHGLGKLFEAGQVCKLICSYAGENASFARQYLDGEVEVEFNPQGTLAERIRAGGAGIPAFYTRTGVGTVVAEGKPVAEFNGKQYLLERSLRADLALVHAWRSDPAANLQYRMTARNFNPLMATAAAITVAEVEEFVGAGEIDPDHIVTPGIFVNRVVILEKVVKYIEQRTVRPRTPTVEE